MRRLLHTAVATLCSRGAAAAEHAGESPQSCQVQPPPSHQPRPLEPSEATLPPRLGPKQAAPTSQNALLIKSNQMSGEIPQELHSG